MAARRAKMYVRPEDLIQKWKILRGDKVEILTGKDAGKQGTVLSVLRGRNAVLVEGLNLARKHYKGNEENKGGIFTKELPIHVSNVAVVCPETNVATRVRWAFDAETGEKIRVAKRSGAVVPRPSLLDARRKPHDVDGSKDTPQSIVQKETFVAPPME